MSSEDDTINNLSVPYTFDESELEGGDVLKNAEFRYYLSGIGGTIVCSLGIIGNIFCVIVLTTKKMRSSTYMYLAALAVCDMLVLITTLMLFVKDTKPPLSDSSLDLYYAFIYPFIHPITVTFQVTSIWLTLAFTVDRYIMICHPFKAERMCCRSRAKKVILAMFLAGIGFNIPRFFEYYTARIRIEAGNTTQILYYIDFTTFGKNEYFREIVHSWLYLICVCGLPFLALTIINGFLIRAVHLSRKKGREINAKEKRRNDTTIMLIGVVIIFLICQGPALVARMMYAFTAFRDLSRSYHTFNEVVLFLVTLNSAINIVPYYFFGKKFRAEFWRLFCVCIFDAEQLNRLSRRLSLSVDHKKNNHVDQIELNGIHSKLAKFVGVQHNVASPLMGDSDQSASEVSDYTANGNLQPPQFYANPAQQNISTSGSSGYLVTRLNNSS
ncbi:FMRFamide receptor-like [Gigantopelta aegis]|uniref:FMRFamide receptor-like n=1 Tax=Gigantopelta aegis TaxID=1735272 RepID=UPI001B887EE9|nr:FMRFamide receptor-like [Gigantopelta aegis]